MNKLLKRIIDNYRIHDQLEEFISYKSRYSVHTEVRKRRLQEVIKTIGKNDIRGWSTHDITEVARGLTGRYSTFYRDSYIKDIRCFIRYCHQRKLTDIKPDWIRDDGNIVVG